MNFLTGLWGWVDERLPVQRAWDTHMGKYYAPKNFNFWYFFGVFSLLILVNQLLTGIWLVMVYVPTAEECGTDGRGLLGLCIALGSNVLLGCSGYCLFVWCYPCCRRRPCTVDSW